jgi:hypothetical protein
MTPAPVSLLELRATHMAEPVVAEFRLPLDVLRARFGESLVAVLLYGSCRRQQDVTDGVVDLYVIVDEYSGAYPGRWLRWLNAALPPNVFYMEVPAENALLRVKYAVVSRADFERGNRDAFHSYFWARFCQPVALLQVRDGQTSHWIAGVLAQATLRFLRAAVPMLGAEPFTADALWIRGFQLTYAAELRPEGSGRPELLVQQDAAYYRQALAAAAKVLEELKSAPGDSYRVAHSESAANACRRAWRWRRGLGCVLSLLRLAKATFTFSGGVDYAAWKVERHTGVHIDVTPQLRRFPLLFGWRVMWQLLRRGALR